jgi:hypothetical protein
MSRVREADVQSEANALREWYSFSEGVVCPRCKRERTTDGHDPCIASLPGVLYACCGHGEANGYIYFENGVCIRMIVTSVELYDTNCEPSKYIGRTDT